MKALVTGGGGFLGGAIVRLLVARGDAVCSFTRSHYSWLNELNVRQTLGDLSNLDAVTEAVRDCDVVFHVAAKAGVWGRQADYIATNVTGTKNIIEACRKAGVSKLVYTSTPSVCHNGLDIEGANESLPYPSRFEADYPRTKAEAERMVIAANDPTLSTVSLRPHLIWGPGDPHLIPRIIERAKKGKLRRIGEKKVVVDTTFVTNAAEAHLLAAEKLIPGADCAGKAYFLSDDSPVVMWDFINEILAMNDIAPVMKTVSLFKAKLAAKSLEVLYRLLFLSSEPPLTKFVVSQLSTSHWYDISAAKRDLGYRPSVSITDGLKLLSKIKGST